MTSWSGSWVESQLGVRLRTHSSAVDLDLRDLVGLALRRNPRRAHLLVSRVLGKHVPTDPRTVHGAGLLLGLLVRAQLCGAAPQGAPLLGALLRQALTAGPAHSALFRDAVVEALATADTPHPAPLVLGYAETAVSLGHSVADALPAAQYLHSTRRAVAGMSAAGGFEEEHSHATSHLLLPSDQQLLRGPAAAARALVLVDDELSTGTTVLNTIAALHALVPRERYVVAALVDLRTPQDDDRLRARADELGTRIDVVCLAAGAVDLPANVLEAGAALVSRLAEAPGAAAPVAAAVDGAARGAAPLGVVRRPVVTWPQGQREGGRHGISVQERQSLQLAVTQVAAALEAPGPGQRVHVLGTEEHMAAPLLLAQALADAHPRSQVLFSTTTRSPALAVDDPGYALRTSLAFRAHEPLGPGDVPQRFAYNVRADPTVTAADRLVLVVDSPAAGPALTAPGGLVPSLVGTGATVDVVEIPAATAPLAATEQMLPVPLHGPAFGSYRPEEVSWLLKDLSHVALEAPTAEREREIQSGRAHYAESLPIEYQPDEDYQRLFHQAVEESCARIAHAVGVVSEILLAERGPDLVLASLARAGTPIGILVRRWLQALHGISPPHHAVSIVRGRGIDAVALRYLAAHHDAADVVFVDGWTGKGAIARELTAALDQHAASTGVRFDDSLAVLADPGACVSVYGTRDDFLIPSACLNSTVSGLVSRTVLNDDLIGPGDFHGAKFYAELASSDVSNLYLDAVTAQFPQVRTAVERNWPAVAGSDRTPTWAGWAAVEQISTAYGIGQVNLVKPGVGETTRVLLRRVPERVLVRTGAAAELPHVLALARQRGVPVEEVPDLPYSCVGLIHPQHGGEG